MTVLGVDRSYLKWGVITTGFCLVTTVALKVLYDIQLERCVQNYKHLEFCSLDSGVKVAFLGLFATATYLTCVLPDRGHRRIVSHTFSV